MHFYKYINTDISLAYASRTSFYIIIQPTRAKAILTSFACLARQPRCFATRRNTEQHGRAAQHVRILSRACFSSLERTLSASWTSFVDILAGTVDDLFFSLLCSLENGSPLDHESSEKHCHGLNRTGCQRPRTTHAPAGCADWAGRSSGSLN